MTVKIEKIDEDTVRVNKKIIRRDSRGVWSAHGELTNEEHDHFYSYLEDKEW